MMRTFNKFTNHPPINSPVEPDPDPAAVANVGRNKNTLGMAFNQDGLRDQSGFAPDGVAALAVVIGGAGERGESLSLGAKVWLTVGKDLGAVRKRQADFPEAGERRGPGHPNGSEGVSTWLVPPNDHGQHRNRPPLSADRPSVVLVFVQCFQRLTRGGEVL